MGTEKYGPVSTQEETRSRLMAEMKAEEVRIVALYMDADWSRSESVYFSVPKKHWWSRARRQTYDMILCAEVWWSKPCKDNACFIWHPTMGIEFICHVRSDGRLIFDEPGYRRTMEDYYAALTLEVISRDLAYLRQCQTTDAIEQTIRY